MTSREGARGLPGNNQERKPQPAFTVTLKRQFRELVRAITRKPLAPQPAARRRRAEDTGKAFRMAARKIICRAVCLPAEAYAVATAYISDTLDWFNPWQHQDREAEENCTPPSSDLYPHL